MTEEEYLALSKSITERDTTPRDNKIRELLCYIACLRQTKTRAELSIFDSTFDVSPWLSRNLEKMSGKDE